MLTMLKGVAGNDVQRKIFKTNKFQHSRYKGASAEARIDRRMSINFTSKRSALQSRGSKNIDLQSISSFVRRNSKQIMEHQSKTSLMKTIHENNTKRTLQGSKKSKPQVGISNSGSDYNKMAIRPQSTRNARKKRPVSSFARTSHSFRQRSHKTRSHRQHRDNQVLLYHQNADLLNTCNQLNLIRDTIELNLKKDKKLRSHMKFLSKSLNGQYDDLEYIEKFRKQRVKSQLSIRSDNEESKVLIKKFQVHDKKKIHYFKQEVARFRREQLQVGHFLRMNSNRNEESLLLKKNKNNLKSLRKMVRRVNVRLFKKKRGFEN